MRVLAWPGPSQPHSRTERPMHPMPGSIARVQGGLTADSMPVLPVGTRAGARPRFPAVRGSCIPLPIIPVVTPLVPWPQVNPSTARVPLDLAPNATGDAWGGVLVSLRVSPGSARGLGILDRPFPPH